ncbi:MAG: GGDEF domain-containing protein [Clostridia bacterium]|jgi:diguanylate cyclase (GGDEF)-like protein|nr:GGDEF domain-containing protein [Clostridia bacterium]
MKGFSISSVRKMAVVSLGVYVLTYYILIGMFSGDQIGLSKTLSDLLTLIGEGTGIIIISFGLRWQEKRHRAEWKMFLLGIMMNFIGDFIWSVFEIHFQKDVPFPSICDAAYLCGSVFYLFALLFYIRNEKLFDIVRTGFDIIITMVVSTTIIFKYIMLPIWNDETITLLQRIISLSYPVMDMGYLGGVFSLFFFCAPKSKLNNSNLLTSLAFIIWFFADQFYAVMSNHVYVSGGFVDPLWPIGCWVLALASLYPHYCKGDEEIKSRNSILNRRQLFREYIRFLFPYFSVSIIVILVNYQCILKDPLVTGTVLTIMLIMIRQIFSLLENKRLISIIQKSNQMLEESKAELEKRNTKLKQLNYLKEHEANTDFLTGLFNRRYINETLRLLPEKEPGSRVMEISILLIDVDHYKQINDGWGHEVGDIVLQQIAGLIKNNIRSEDIAGRFGGDEFIVILPDADLKSAKFIAERLIQKTNTEKFADGKKTLRVTLSIGCVRWRGFTKNYNMNTIISAADKALYMAKAGGRNQCRTGELF